MAFVFFLLSMLWTPAPKQPPALVPGCLDMQWGGVRQVCFFCPTGSYTSTPYTDETDRYSLESADDGRLIVRFTERGRRYVMIFDANGCGSGAYVRFDADGWERHAAEVIVKLTPRQRLPVGPPK